MGSVTQNFFKLFRGPAAGPAPAGTRPASGRIARRSSGLGELSRSIAGRQGLCVLDLGATSATNISLLTGIGHKVYTEDVLSSSYDSSLLVHSDDGKASLDVVRFLAENLAFQPQIFDSVLAWDVFDYLPEPLVKPVVERLCSVTKPGGVLLGFFHTRDAGPEAPHYRYHIAGNDMLQLQPTSGNSGGPLFRLQRVFNNRHIENLFREFASLKFFLARDNVREVLVVR